jgi:hypothetical protein
MRKRETTKRKYTAIRNDYEKMSTKYKHTYILEKLAEKYFMEATSIEDVIYRKDEKPKDNQYNLFDQKP